MRFAAADKATQSAPATRLNAPELKAHPVTGFNIPRVDTETALPATIVDTSNMEPRFASPPTRTATGNTVASVSETLAHGSSRTEYRLRHKDGHYRWVADDRRVVRNTASQSTELVGVWTDISEQKHSGDALRASEQRYKALFEQAAFTAKVPSSTASRRSTTRGLRHSSLGFVSPVVFEKQQQLSEIKAGLNWCPLFRGKSGGVKAGSDFAQERGEAGLISARCAAISVPALGATIARLLDPRRSQRGPARHPTSVLVVASAAVLAGVPPWAEALADERGGAAAIGLPPRGKRSYCMS